LSAALSAITLRCPYAQARAMAASTPTISLDVAARVGARAGDGGGVHARQPRIQAGIP
jgi:hypothetical protein